MPIAKPIKANYDTKASLITKGRKKELSVESMKIFEAFTVIGFGLPLTIFVIGELIVTWRRELRQSRCEIPRQKSR